MGQKESKATQQQIDEYYERRHSFLEKPEERKARLQREQHSAKKHKKSKSKDLGQTLQEPQEQIFLRANNEIKLADDPGERDYFSICPHCSARILETGLESEIVCTCCSFRFKTKTNSTLRIGDGDIEQRYLNKREEQKLQQRTAMQRFSQPLEYRSYNFNENSKEEYDEDEEEEDEDEEEKYGYDDYESNPFEISEEQIYVRNEIHHLNSQIKTLNSVTLLVIQETLLDDFIIKDKNEQEREMRHIGEVKDIYKNIEHKAISLGNTQDLHDYKEQSSPLNNQTEEEKKEVNELLAQENELQGSPEERAAKNSLKSVKFDLLIKQILLPFFQIQTRILQKGNIFEIGTIKFLVAATTPFKQGKVGTKTKIRCNLVVSQEAQLESVELIPLKKNSLPSNSTFINDVVNPFLRSLKPREVYTHKHAIIELDDIKFLIKYSRPFFGYFSENTKVKIDDYAKALSFIRIAPIWKDEKTCKEVNENFAEYEQLIRNKYLDVYFHSGLSRFVEKGETIFIENLEFFVNDCRPKNGYVDERTQIEIQTGFTQENFKRKQIQADKNFAKRLQSRESHRTQLYHLSQALGRAVNSENPEELSEFDREMLGATRQIGEDLNNLRQRLQIFYHHAGSKKKPASKSLVQSLPERTLTKKFIDEKKTDSEESYIKCLICLEYYEVDECVKTLPCMHFFHKGCIESWFNRGRTCPVCKWDISKDVDSASFGVEST